FTDTSWELSFQNTVISSGYGATFQHQFTQAGVYNLSASSPQSCEAAITSINVLNTPVLNGAIAGDSQICAGQPYTYSYPSVSNDYVLHWEIEGGVIQGPSQGNQINVIFNQNVPA
ncbi:hypothetical protein RZS08_42430, partial [Arthrospira platensis SPKY1]|nr:hypothetical protein [Arthrospira platensis SPKY1]